MRQRRVLLISAAIGGGHDAVSRALAEGLEERGASVATEDFYDAQFPHLSTLVSKLNRAWLLHFGRMYQWVWNRLVCHGPVARLASGFFWLTGTLAVRRLVKRHRPDLVVATYPMCVPALARMRRKGRLQAPVVSYPNDFHAHVLWVADGVDLYLAPTAEAVEWLEEYGVNAPIELVGIPVRRAFATIPDKATAQASIGFSGERPVVLATAGGDGVGHLDEVVATLDSFDVDIAVICGRNKGLRDRVEALGTRAVAVGFVEDMERWLAAADVLVGTPGPISSSEAFCAGTPVVSYRPYTGHGIDNAKWVERAGAGWVVDDPDALSRLMGQLLNEPGVLSGAAASAASLGRPAAIDDAVDALVAAQPGVIRLRRRWARRVAVAAASLVAVATVALEAPALAAGRFHVGVVRHVAQPGPRVAVLVQGPRDAAGDRAVISALGEGGGAVTYLTTCGAPDPALLGSLAERRIDVGVVGDSRLLSTPGAVRAALRRCRDAIAASGATASAFLPRGERYSWGAYVGSAGWRRMFPAYVVDLTRGADALPSGLSAGDVVLLDVSAQPSSLAALGSVLDEMRSRGLQPVSVTELLAAAR